NGPSNEIQVGCPVFRALEIIRPRLARGGVHVGAQIYRSTPTEVVLRIIPPRHINVDGTLPAWSVALEEEEVSVNGQSGLSFSACAVDSRSEIHRRFPRTVLAGAL